MTTHWIPAALSGATDLATVLTGAVHGPGLVLGLAVIAISALRLVLEHRLRAKAVAKAVAKAEAGDLPALFRTFAPAEKEPDPPDGASP
ncbi:hypothetical protein [Streptomyces griseolus]|uniref:hypothetical protein n=1 Tax=Streptomyces griseolus TaxID=1909 RepID=UPI002243066B|nr:hypothetical protein [Streptomyces griseolus]MCW8217300.1 hypothetical protein [Streptomyces griseolus]